MAWRNFLAIFISLLILLTWPFLARKIFHYPIDNKNVTIGVTSELSTQNEIESKVQVAQLQPQQEVKKEATKKPLGKIAKLLLAVVNFLHNILKNLGLAIIALSVLIWLVFSPLTAKSMKAMQKMQSLQPKIEQLKQAHKDTPQKLNKEIMALYREEKVNPLGGCLPMLLQLPIFMGLYQMFTNSGTLNDANFLWIKDLSKPDRLFMLSNFPINILPIITALIMAIQQRQSSKYASGMQAEQQKMMNIVFPLMFGAMFYNMPSGLVLYWLVNSFLMVLAQWKTTQTQA